ncbi:MAG: 23S rRNA (guanosine(2251)-2'-O)-methyltransferase RlmB [Ignavibacteriota bacterium]
MELRKKHSLHARRDVIPSYVVGRRAALELLRDEIGREKIEKLYIAHGSQGPAIAEILHLVRTNKVPHGEIDRRKYQDLESREGEGVDSQGVMILLKAQDYAEIEDVLGEKRTRTTAPLFIALDGIEDPHNMGAIIRTSEAAGADAVLIPKRGAVLTPAVYKASAGAATHIPIIKYGNLAETLARLQKEFAFACYGLAGEGEGTIFDAKYVGATCLVIGSEDKGLHQLTRKRCDGLIKIPLYGKTESLNASVAAAIAIFEVVRQRNGS